MLTDLESKLLDNGYNYFGINEKNEFIKFLANRNGVPFNQITDEYILGYHKELKIEKLSKECESNILSGFTASNGKVYRTNRDDQINMIGQKDKLQSDETITSVMWKTEDSGYAEHTREEWTTVYGEAFDHKSRQLFKYDRLKNLILGATTDTEVTNIGWDMQIGEPTEDTTIE
jgi:hypothetical protein